jgi:iron-sulfur cluster assembly protein
VRHLRLIGSAAFVSDPDLRDGGEVLSAIGRELMLTLTENARTIVKGIASHDPEASGLRITSESKDEPAFGVTVAVTPEPGDQVVEQDGATVYLDPPASEQLEDKVLDAAVDQSGNVEFTLTFQG